MAQSSQDKAGWVTWIIQELGRSQAKEFLFATIEGIVLGALFGAIFAVAAALGFRRLGWYDVPWWRFGRWVRWSAYTLTIVICVLALGAAGFWAGVVSGSEQVLRKSQLGTDLFPRIAEAMADGMAWLQIRARQSKDDTEREVAAKLEEFRAGQWELDAPQFLEHFDDFRETAFKEYVVKLEESALQRAPKLRGSLSEKLLHELLHGLATLLAQKQLGHELEKWGVGRTFRAIREQLVSEAARRGEPNTISRRELSVFIVMEGMVPGILGPIRSFCRAQQLGCLLIAGITVFLPAAALRLARRFQRAPERQSPAQEIS